MDPQGCDAEGEFQPSRLKVARRDCALLSGVSPTCTKRAKLPLWETHWYDDSRVATAGFPAHVIAFGEARIGAPTMPDEQSKPQPPVESGKLTRRFLNSLPDGLFLVSSVYDKTDSGNYVPCFAEKVLPASERDEQWQRVRAAHADGRHCDLFVDETHCTAWKKTVTGAPWNV